MIKFVNAKLNLGLNIVGRRADGYHDLETLFYPVGIYNGTPQNPEPFCDILEITSSVSTEFIFTGRQVDCLLEKNLVYKAWHLFKENYPDLKEYAIRLDKHLPDGAGLGGGSADATFTLRMLNELSGNPFSDTKLAEMALRLGADCPFFVYNSPCFAQGVGDRLTPARLNLSGWWALLVKPDISVSTKEAFTGVVPARPAHPVTEIAELPVEEWNGLMVNDFEASIFPNHIILSIIKENLLAHGAVYASMSGSGSTVFGLFKCREAALKVKGEFSGHYTALCLL